MLLRGARKDIDVAQVSIGSATSADLLYQCQYWTGFEASVVIVQAGLCDCLPPGNACLGSRTRQKTFVWPEHPKICRQTCRGDEKGAFDNTDKQEGIH